MNQYETVFILTPVLSDVQMKEAVEKFKGILTAEGAEIVNEENWGLKKLAYPIQKKSTGFYQLIEFNAEPTVIEKLEINFRRDFALKTIWIDDNYFNARSMDVYITKLRKHLKEDDSIEIINIHGKGYKLIAPEAES